MAKHEGGSCTAAYEAGCPAASGMGSAAAFGTDSFAASGKVGSTGEQGDFDEAGGSRERGDIRPLKVVHRLRKSVACFPGGLRSQRLLRQIEFPNERLPS
jgi:hypothetical protein